MKKSAALIGTFVLLMCTAFSAQICHADTVYVEKDTSWFDYQDPKESYTIRTEAQLLGLASLVNEEQIDRWKPTRLENFEDVTFTLARDIELTGAWTPIGKGGASYFAGTFDGNGHTISNVYVRGTSDYAGLFGSLSGEVKNLTVQGKVTSSYSSSGGIVGYLEASAKVTDCVSDVKVKGKDKVGGIAGFSDGGTVNGCINLGSVSGTHKIGGIVGENWGGKIIECGNRGAVKSTRRGVSTYGTGGVAGRSVSATAQISKSYNVGEITSYTEATGGVVGYANANGTSIENCYSTGKITISDSKGETEITDAYAGGVAGIAGVTGVIIKNCYSAGEIENADVTGGVIGLYVNEMDDIRQYIFNNYYLRDHYGSGIGELYDSDDPNLTDAVRDVPAGAMDSLQNSLSVSYMEDTGEYGNNGYPVLTWQQPVSEEEEEYLLGIPEENQKMLKRYLIRNADVIPPGQTIVNFFKPDNVMSKAFIIYMEAKDKTTEHIGDDVKNEQDTTE